MKWLGSPMPFPLYWKVRVLAGAFGGAWRGGGGAMGWGSHG